MATSSPINLFPLSCSTSCRLHVFASQTPPAELVCPITVHGSWTTPHHGGTRVQGKRERVHVLYNPTPYRLLQIKPCSRAQEHLCREAEACNVRGSPLQILHGGLNTICRTSRCKKVMTRLRAVCCHRVIPCTISAGQWPRLARHAARRLIHNAHTTTIGVTAGAAGCTAKGRRKREFWLHVSRRVSCISCAPTSALRLAAPELAYIYALKREERHESESCKSFVGPGFWPAISISASGNQVPK